MRNKFKAAAFVCGLVFVVVALGIAGNLDMDKATPAYIYVIAALSAVGCFAMNVISENVD